MSIGAAIYSYRNNFDCKTSPTKKGRTTKIKLFNLIVSGYRTLSKYDDDYFISIAQYLMKKGYPKGLSVSKNIDNVDKFFMDALFSICPFHFQNLMINSNKFNVLEYRKQFELFGETELKGLNFYRNRGSMPLENFSSMENIYRIIYPKSGKYNEIELLKFSFNSSWKDAIWILNKYCLVAKDRFYYKIAYGCKDDFDKVQKGGAGSSWDITIESDLDENYIDFCLRIYQNYDAIISGSKDVLISKSYNDNDLHFYLGAHFLLRRPQPIE